jgi:eukaryotic-like serine/threonine-protein kinase
VGVEPTEPARPYAQIGRAGRLAPGAVVGRFIVHRMLGTGGAGVVYAAHDPDLDRTIALKVLHRELADRADARARFLREAQALARLSHPNIISVYDVGSADGCTFIAMEYIAGQTFAEWVASSAPSWSEIVDVLVKAGRGLAAAHAAGLIHRDFKPANLLVGVDGRVMVTDFGLAREVVEADPDAGPRTDREPRGSVFAQSITRTGAVQGTPAYMAPEQHHGRPADARADQFSFCVTLYEAVFRAHPFPPRPSPSPAQQPPTTGDEPGAATAHEPPHSALAPAPSDARGAPVWLLRAAQRGLSPRPEDRHADMNRLLAALTREPLRRRRRIQLGLAVLALAVTVGLGVRLAAVRDPTEDSCTGGAEQRSRVWNPAVAHQVKAAFSASARPYGPSSAQRVAERLDDYTHDWATMHRAACLATARGEQSPDLLDRRMVCLSRRLAQVGALLELFVRRADGELVDRALTMVANLEPLPACADSAALLARIASPADPVRRVQVSALERQVDRAELDRHTGRAQAAADAARAALEAGRTLDHPPLDAQAGRVLGRALEDLSRPVEARQALVLAQRAAERAGDARLAAHILIDLTKVVGLREKRSAEGQLLGQLAEAALERPELQADSRLRARLLEALGGIAAEVGDGKRALDLLRQVHAIHTRAVPASPDDVASAAEQLGAALSNMGHHTEAGVRYREALEIRQRVLGADHPLIANLHITMGATYMEESGDAAQARAHLLAALAILERVPTYRSYPALLHNLATLENIVGNHDQARRYHEAALEVRQRQLGPDHLDVAVSLLGLGDVHYATGDFAQALEVHRRALAIYERNAATDHAYYGAALSTTGEDLRRLDDAAGSLPYQERALQILGDRLSAHLIVGYVQAHHGLALFDLGRRREAIPKLEHALELIPPGEVTRARAAFALARGLAPRGPLTQRARELAREALAIFTAVRAAGEQDQVAAYLGTVR